MEVYVVLIGGVIQDKAFTALRPLCKHYGLSYSSVMKKTKGKLKLYREAVVTDIVSVRVEKIKGRNNNFKKKLV